MKNKNLPALETQRQVTTAIAPVPGEGLQSTRYEPRNLEDAFRLAQLVIESGIAPSGVRNKEQAFIILATGAELGLTAMQALRTINIIKGKPVMAADLMKALCVRSPQCVFFRRVKMRCKQHEGARDIESFNCDDCIARDSRLAVYETQRKGSPSPERVEFTIEDAKKADLLNGQNWRKYPRAMLKARAKAELARDVYPDLLAGLYTDEEMDAVRRAERRDEIGPPREPDNDNGDGDGFMPPAIDVDIVRAPRAPEDNSYGGGGDESPLNVETPAAPDELPAVEGTDEAPQVALCSQGDVDHLLALVFTSALEAGVDRLEAQKTMHRYIRDVQNVPNARHLPFLKLPAAISFASDPSNFRDAPEHSPVLA